MAQKYFSAIKKEYDSEAKKNLLEAIKNISIKFRQQIKGKKTLEDLLIHSKQLVSKDLVVPQKPEIFTISEIVKPLLRSLGYGKSDIISETYQEINDTGKWADFTLTAKDKRILVEVEPLNKDLKRKNCGIDQIKKLILQKPIETDYGMATDGFKWILMKYDRNSHKSRNLVEIDIQPIFAMEAPDQRVLIESDIDKILKEFYESFSRDNISATLEERFYQLETHREIISQKFYSGYMKIVFGIHPKSGAKLREYCLLKAIKSPSDTTQEEIGLFAVNFMNRLLFIKFLEDVGIVPNELLKEMWKRFAASRENVLSTFYKSILEPLFFGVFNTPLYERDPHIQQKPYFNKIPYLNGGLFRTILENEEKFNVEDEILRIIINNFIEKYSFTISGERGLDPDILGNVFEKTINYISKPGSDAQKAKGAYYTPDDVVTFITKKTLYPYLLDKIIGAYIKTGWSESDLRNYTTLESFLSNLPRTKGDIKEALDIVDNVLILDPACGSGHFLTSALKELVYIKRRLLDEIGEEYDLYELKREIIRRNLFGIDIEEPAIEIAKLRLWLSLMEDIELSNSQHIGTLPNIEYNICQGDSLIGWIDESMEQEMLTKPYDDKEIQEILKELETVYAENHIRLITIKEVKESLNTHNVDKILRAYISLKKIYKLESKEKAATLKTLIEKIHEKIYSFVTKKYANYLGKKKSEIRPENLKDVFHWGINFYDAIGEGGFDIVIGNPPYIEVPKHNRKHLKEYRTRKCGNTHAYFYERSLRLVKSGGFCGLIVPISSVSTDRMKDLQKLLMEESSDLWISNYDDRPGKLFSDLEHCRSSIIISQKKTEDNQPLKIFTTKYNRWYSENRSALFKDIEYTESTGFVLEGSIPKLGIDIEKSILTKIRKDKKLINYLDEEKGDGTIWYHNAPQYWIRALDFVPYFWNERDGQKISSHLVELNVRPANYRKIVAAILNSSLFYWFFVVHSNGRDLVSREIENFPLSIEKVPESLFERLEKVFDELMEDYKRNAERKECYYKTTGKVKYDEFQPGLSKGIIDRIDDLLAECYGFTDEEKDFMKDFDIEFRMRD